MQARMKLKAKYSGRLKLHWQWCVILSLSLLILVILLFMQSRKAGLIGLIFTCLYGLALLGIYFYMRPGILRELMIFAQQYGEQQQMLLQELSLPMAMLEPDGRVIWINDSMSQLIDKPLNFHKNIITVFPAVNRGSLPSTEWERQISLEYQGKQFRADIRRLSLEDMIQNSALIEPDVNSDYCFILYLFDETALNVALRENREQKGVTGLVYLDNYEEVMERTDEVHQSLLNVLVERRFNKYFDNVDSLIKKLEKDKYLLVMNQKALGMLMDDRFSLLEDVKTINIGNEVRITVSIGIGAGGSSQRENYEEARAAIEMALGRGGDQVVIKEGEKLTFYGGKTRSNEKNTHVRARVKAQALRDLILAKDRIVVMGHSMTDMDAFGAAVGVAMAAISVGKKAHIVLGELNTNIRDWVARFRSSKDYDSDLFVDHEQARSLVTSETLVVVVDTNQPSRTECRELLSMTSSIVVLDHHRQGAETIENASLSYIEPSASSACEMIAEILQYFENNVRLRNLEADCIYAGIIIDTNGFVAKTGVRTFEAAAYLRRCGADVIRVRKALRDDMASYKARAEVVSNAEEYMERYALSICRGEGMENPSVTGAQAANELLNITGVRASFVVTGAGDRVFISARSIDEVNVQLVMERMGGGGHMNIAGAQLDHVTVEEAMEKVKEVLKSMTEEGEI